MELSLRALIRASSVLALALLAPAACSSSSDNDGGSSAPVADTPTCGAGRTLVLEGTLDGKPVSQTLMTQGYFLDQLSNPKSANVPFGGGKMNLGWTTIVADGETAPLTSAVLQLPGETSEHITSSGTIYLGPTERDAHDRDRQDRRVLEPNEMSQPGALGAGD